MSYAVTLHEKHEKAASRHTAVVVNNALKFSGTEVLIFRPKIELTTDEVYGIYAGSDLRESNSYSIYDRGRETEDIIEITGTESSTDNDQEYAYNDPVKCLALITANTWRQIDGVADGFFEDPIDLWCSAKVDIEPGDVVQITRDDGESLRFKVIAAKTIGASTDIVRKLQLSNVGD
jgi:hypothetical protein|nr:MAG TPA: hypothetical protein [Caudoviricetes sp.]